MAIERGVEPALALLEAGRLQEARAYCEALLGEHPRHFDALCMVCCLAMQTYDLLTALHYINRALDIDDGNATAHFNRGAVLQGLRNSAAALESYRRAIAIQPLFAEAHCNKAALELELGLPKDAFASASRAIQIRNDFPEALFNRANAQHALRRFGDAIIDYNSAVAMNPSYAEAYCNLGIAQASLQLWPAAASSFANALAIRPGYVKALTNLGNLSGELREWAAALRHFDRALDIDPGYGDAWANRGAMLRQLRQHGAALESFERAYEVTPEVPGLLGMLLHQKLTMCEWTRIDSLRNLLTEHIRLGRNPASPFEVLGLIDDPQLQRIFAETWAAAKYPADADGPPIGTCSDGVLTVAYFSADFHVHATAYLIAELFELHDRARFRIIGVSFGPDSDDPMRRRLAMACDHFVDVRNQSDAQIAALARQMRIDIAVDLKGYTTDARPGVFARRAAPIQVNYLGYPGTLGVAHMDYIITDSVIMPGDHFGFFSEKICRLPHCYQPNDRKRKISERQYLRAELGLPQEAFVFCCFNNSWKITPEVFECWMTLLRRVPRSVLWLLEDNEWQRNNLTAATHRSGIDASRLIFAVRMPLEEHLARHRCADLFVDTWPYCAHTTASDALWAGLPLIACLGRTFAARVSASLLHYAGLPELIATDPTDYIAKAISLADDRKALCALRRRLEKSRLKCELFDTERYARHLEAGYLSMAERARAGRSPDHLLIDPL